MIGQSFAPIGDPNMQRPSGGPGGIAPGAQEAIKVLNLRIPRVAGAGAPAPQALLEGGGSGALPQQPNNPIIQAILQAVLGHFAPQQQSAPSAMGGGMPGTPGPLGQSGPQLPNPKINYQPLPGGTAGPNPMERETREDRQTRQGKSGMDNFLR